MGFQKKTIKFLRALLPDFDDLVVQDSHTTVALHESGRRRKSDSLPPPNGRQERVQAYKLCLRAIFTLMNECLDDKQRREARRMRLSNVQSLFPYFIQQWQLEEFDETDVAPDKHVSYVDRELYRNEVNGPRQRNGEKVDFPSDEIPAYGAFDESGSDPTDVRFIIQDLRERLRLAIQARDEDAKDHDDRERDWKHDMQASAQRVSKAESELRNKSFQHQQEADKLRGWVEEWRQFHNSTMQTTQLAHEKAVTLAVTKAMEKTRDESEVYYNGFIKKERKAHSDVIKTKNEEIATRDTDIQLLEDQIANERGEHQSTLRDKETRYRNDMAHLKATLMDQMEEQKKSYERKLAEAASEAAGKIAELENRMALMKQGYEKEIARLKTEHAQVIAKMEQEHAEEMAKAVSDLKQKITAMNAILFARDGFTPVPDRLLKEKFLSLRHDVQYLSRQSWREDQPFWTTGVLMDITSNPDKVREQLLRDELWWILIDHVFASPFRMFGDEARTLEGQWNSGCGKDPDLRTGDFIWPQPSFEAEKFRYEAIKQCQTALKEPASHLDPRAKVRKGFIQSRERLSKALQNAISSVAEADQVVFTDIDKVVKKVIGLWLEFELQRCRLMVVMPTSRVNSDEDKLALAKEHRLELTSLPALIRFGDDEGQDLDVRQKVGSCSEEIVRVS